MSEQVNMAAHYEHEIPEGYEAKIEGNKVIIELKESEDERICKYIQHELACLRAPEDKGSERYNELTYAIAYLEKQKECSFCDFPKSCADCPKEIQAAIDKEFGIDGRDDNDNPLNGYGDWKKGMVLNGPAIWGLVKLGNELHKKQKPVKNVSRDEYVKRFKTLCEGYEIKLPNREYDIYHLCDDLSKLSMDSGKQQPNIEICPHSNKPKSYKENGYPIEQKPAEWSEKDEARKERLISIVKRALHGNEYCLLSDKGATELITWLNALHERLKSQSKKEWSKEDEDMLNSIIATCQLAAQDRSSRPAWHLFEMQEKFLKSFRPHWKPSEQEKGALRTAIHILTEERNFPKAGAQLQNILNAFEGKESRKDWKPSEEQMDALADATMRNVFPQGNIEHLESLYNDLKSNF